MKVVVAGALGLIGRALIRQCVVRSDIEVVGLSRRAPDALAQQPRCRFRSVDLQDHAATREALADVTDATHLVFAAWGQPDTPKFNASSAAGARETETNLGMLRNVVETLESTCPRFAHVTLMQGSKAYGMHFGPIHEPARETDPRTMPPNFYYDQEDYLVARSRNRDWSWTIFRPVSVFGFAAGSPINIMTALGAYAAVSKHLGLPLRFPGPEAAFRIMRNAIDADLLGRAIVWAADRPECRGEIFNIANGDLYSWQRLWPHVARVFRMETAEPQTQPLVDIMACHDGTWDDMRRQHGLVYGLRELAHASWPIAEGHFKRTYDGLVNPLKLRKFGFHDFSDTQEMVERHLLQMMREKVLPDYAGS